MCSYKKYGRLHWVLWSLVIFFCMSCSDSDNNDPKNSYSETTQQLISIVENDGRVKQLLT